MAASNAYITERRKCYYCNETKLTSMPVTLVKNLHGALEIIDVPLVIEEGVLDRRTGMNAWVCVPCLARVLTDLHQN